MRNTMATLKLSKLKRISESMTVYRYDNGFMVEVNGRNSDDEWTTKKIICNTEEELFALVKEANKMELDT